MEKPSYLGAIQAFSQYQPVFYPVELTEEGMDIEQLKDALKHDVKFIYAIPDFQNPTGLSYCAENRACIREVLREREIVWWRTTLMGNCALTRAAVFLISGRPAAGQHSAGDIFKDSDPGHANRLYDLR